MARIDDGRDGTDVPVADEAEGRGEHAAPTPPGGGRPASARAAGPDAAATREPDPEPSPAERAGARPVQATDRGATESGEGDGAPPAPAVAAGANEPRSEDADTAALADEAGTTRDEEAAAAPLPAEPARSPEADAERAAADDRDDRAERDERAGRDERAEPGARDAAAEERPAPVAPPVATARTDTAPPPAAPAPPRPMDAAVAPPPPKQRSNRLAGTAWVLLASGVFEVLLLVAIALYVLLAGGASAVPQAMQQVLRSQFAWLPVLLFFLLFELTVLLLNRTRPFGYTVASLVVGAIVWLLFTVLFLAMQQGGLANEASLGRALVDPEFLIVGLVAREVMLWTGHAIGSRGRRVRQRNRDAREQYEQEVRARDGSGASA